MTASPRLPAAVAILALLLIFFVSVVYESGRVPIGQAVRAEAPKVAIGLLPLLLILWQLRNGPDRVGLALGIAFPVVVFGLIAIALFRMLGGNSEQAMNFLMTILMFLMSRSGFLIELIFLPALGWLLVSSMLEFGTISAGSGAQFLAAAFAFTALAVVVPLKKWKPVARPEMRSFAASQSLHAFHSIYPCIWRIAGPDGANGFPATLAELSAGDDGAQIPVCAGWREHENETHSIQYSRRDSGFVLTISERARRGAPSIRLSVDETGIVRQALLDSAGREVEKERKILNLDPLLNLLFLNAWIERYASVNPEIGYPRRIIGGESEQLIEGDVLRLISPFGLGATKIPNASCLLTEGRTVIYTPTVDSSGRVTAYSIAVLPRLPHRTLGLNELRSYLRDESGVVHATGAPRAATRGDPVITADEQTIAAERAADWIKDRDQQAKVQAKFRAEHFPAKPR